MFEEGIIEKPNVEGTAYYVNQHSLLIAVGGDNSAWHYCREIFHDQWDNANTKYFFLRPTLPITEVAKFITILEKVMKVNPPSKIHKARYKVSCTDSNVFCTDSNTTSSSPAVPVKKRYSKSNPKPDFDLREDAICLYPSPFWLEHPVKLAFLTAAIKIVDWEEHIDYSQLTSPESIADYLIDLDEDNEYFLNTQIATKRFLKGYTKVTRSRKRKTGWLTVFGPNDQKRRAEQFLVKP